MSSTNPLSLFIAYQFISLISKDFTEWQMFKIGLIDKDGKKIREPVTPKERKFFNSWFNMVRNVKRALRTVPGGKSKFASYATAFALLRDSRCPDVDHEILNESIVEMAEIHEVPWPTEPAVSRPSGSLQPGTYIVVSGQHEEELDGRPIVVDKPLAAESAFFRTPIFRLIDTAGKTYFVTKDEVVCTTVDETTVAADVAAPPNMGPRKRRVLKRSRPADTPGNK